jgi:hypothetical protein
MAIVMILWALVFFFFFCDAGLIHEYGALILS